MRANQGFYASSLWERPTNDDACEQAANEFGKILTGQAGENLLLSSDLSQMLSQLPSADAMPSPLWVQYEPETVTSLYQLQVACGASALLTQTAGCTSNLLDELDEHLSCYEICNRAVRAAYAAAPRFVLGTITSAQMYVAEQDSPAARQIRALYTEQVRALVDAQVHALFIADMTNVEDALCAVSAAHLVCSRPIVCSLDAASFTSHYDTRQLFAVHRRLVDAGADAIGLTNVPLADDAQSASRIQILAQDLASIAATYGVGTLMTINPNPTVTEQAFFQVVKQVLSASISVFGAGKDATAQHIAALSTGFLSI
ncbi:homocysteine S-methyltransferase family protein [Atopobium fossor]|uniref:homocysteine S-methyltransferase family protein n=1 Tax=Atopobium fossor TaxID=39487 RepID=UPI0003FE878F|nr:homocysteine S-methyltransferase family protein [Atopobium fossor]